MVVLFEGVIANSTPIKEFLKKDGTMNYEAVLHLQQYDGSEYPAEVAVKVTGALTNYVHCVGMRVRVYLCCRVYSSKRDGCLHIGNDIYARAIFLLDEQGNPKGVARKEMDKLSAGQVKYLLTGESSRNNEGKEASHE